jgi:hypothetical protein
MDKVAEVEGRVAEVRWINPHIFIYVADSAGQRWEVEAGPVNLLTRMGIEKDMIKVGETIRVRGNPGRRDPHSLWVSNILLANNTELLAAPGAQQYWTSTTVGDASSFFVAGDLKLPDGSARSFFRTWSPLISAFPRPRGTPTLTDEGKRAQARYESGEQAVGDCEVPGMPYAMMSPYPIEIVDQGDRLAIGSRFAARHTTSREPCCSRRRQPHPRRHRSERRSGGSRATSSSSRPAASTITAMAISVPHRAIAATSSSASSCRPTASLSTTRSP